MPRLRPLAPEDAEGTARQVFEEVLKERGKIPNLMRTYGHRPEHLRTLVAHLRTTMRAGTVPPRLKELIAVRVSRLNASEYCQASHSSQALQLGATPAQIDALTDLTGWGEATVAGFPADCIGTAPTVPPLEAGTEALFSAAERAALRLADQMTVSGGRIDDETFFAAREHFDAGQIIEITSVIGLFNYLDRVASALEVEVTP